MSRPILTLLQIMLDRIDEFDPDHGLCKHSVNLCCAGHINDDELRLIDNYMNENAPEQIIEDSEFDDTEPVEAYWWSIPDVESRRQWLINNIAKLETNAEHPMTTDKAIKVSKNNIRLK